MNYKNYDNYGKKHSNYYKGPGYYYKKTFIPVDKSKRTRCITKYSSLISILVIIFSIFNLFVRNGDILTKERLKYCNEYEIKRDENLDNEFMYMSLYKEDSHTYSYVVSTGTKDNLQTMTYMGYDKSSFIEVVSSYFPDKSEELTDCINKINEYGIESNNYYSFDLYAQSTNGNLTYSNELSTELKKFKTLTGYELSFNKISYSDISYNLETTPLYFIFCIGYLTSLIIILIYICVISHKLNVIKKAEKAGDASKYYEGETSYEEYIEKVKLEEEKREKIKQEKKKKK